MILLRPPLHANKQPATKIFNNPEIKSTKYNSKNESNNIRYQIAHEEINKKCTTFKKYSSQAQFRMSCS